MITLAEGNAESKALEGVCEASKIAAIGEGNLWGVLKYKKLTFQDLTPIIVGETPLPTGIGQIKS